MAYSSYLPLPLWHMAVLTMLHPYHFPLALSTKGFSGGRDSLNASRRIQMIRYAHYIKTAAWCVESEGCACTADPILAYSAAAEVNQLQWSNTQPDWVAICFSNKTQILRV